MAAVTRRQTLVGMAAATFASSASAGAARPKTHDVIVIGAGTFGAWTAEMLRRAGKRVLLVDAWAPANARASSGGESRMTRGAYGGDEIYSRMASESLVEWKRLSEALALPIFHQTGVLFFFEKEEDYALKSLDVNKRLGLSMERLEPKALKKRWPQLDWTGIRFGLYEPDFGALMARRAIESLVASFVRAGGAYRHAAIAAPKQGQPLKHLTTSDGEKLYADQYVFACGPWLKTLFPSLLGDRLFVTRQEVFYFAPDAGDRRFGPSALPGWADFNEGDLYYGFPDLEGRGFKIAHDRHGPPVDPDAEDRTPSPEALAVVRAYMARRFPALAKAPLSEARVCQYENSANGDFLIDRHPDWPQVLLVGMGSGHGFKHGPAVGRRAADLILGNGSLEPRFSLKTKSARQDRAVY